MKQADNLFIDKDIIYTATYKAFGYTPANTYMNRFLLLDFAPTLKEYGEWVRNNDDRPDDATYREVFKFIEEKDGTRTYPLVALFFDLKASVPTYYLVEGQSKGIFDNEEDDIDIVPALYKMVVLEGEEFAGREFTQLIEDEIETILEADQELHLFYSACVSAIYMAHKMCHLVGDSVYCKAQGNEAVGDGSLLDIHLAAQYEVLYNNRKSLGVPVIQKPEMKRPQMKVTYHPVSMMWSYFVDGKLIAEDGDAVELVNKCARIMRDNQCSSFSTSVILQFLGDCYFALTKDMRTLN